MHYRSIIKLFLILLFCNDQTKLHSTIHLKEEKSEIIRKLLLNNKAPHLEFKNDEKIVFLKEYEGKNCFLIFLPKSSITSFKSENTSFLIYLQKIYTWLKTQNTEILVLTHFTADQIKTLKEKWHLSLPIFTATENEYLLYGATDEFQTKRRTSFYIDEKQTIRASFQRSDPEYHLAQLLLTLLAENSVAINTINITESFQKTKNFDMACIDDKAPNIILKKSNGVTSSLTDHFGKKILLYFLPNKTIFDPELPARYDHETFEHLTLLNSLQPWFEKNNGIMIGLTKLPTETIDFLKKEYNLNIDLYHAKGPQDMFGLYGVHGDFDDLYRTSFLIDEQGIIRCMIQQDDPYHHIFHILFYLLTE